MARKKAPRVRHMPTLTAEQLDEVRAWLQHWVTQAMTGEAQCRAASRFDEMGIQARNAQYWSNVASGIEWIDHHLSLLARARARSEAG